MHPQANDGIRRMAHRVLRPNDSPTRVLDLAGMDVNGTAHDMFPYARIDVIDIVPGPGVTIVADATVWVPPLDYRVDIVMTTEGFEHIQDWPALCRLAYQVCEWGFIGTCAGPGRAPHGATGAPLPADGEWYQNVPPLDLVQVLADAGFSRYGVSFEHNPLPESPTTDDVHFWAIP